MIPPAPSPEITHEQSVGTDRIIAIVAKSRKSRNTVGKTICAASTLDKAAKDLEFTDNKEAAAFVGTEIAKKALEKGVKKVVFDRGGFIYHGKIQALADAAREAGLEF